MHLLPVLSVGLLLVGAPADAALTRDQQRCVNAQNKNLGKVAVAFGKQIERCVRGIAKGTESRTLSECVDDDDSGKIARAAQKAGDDDVRRCQGVDSGGTPKAPGVFYTGSANSNAAATASAESLETIVFGGTEDVFLKSDQPFGAQCQRAVLQSLAKCQATRLKEFEKCKRNALSQNRSPFPSGATTPSELETCLSVDSKGRIEQKCTLDVLQAIGEKCRDNSTWETFVASGICPACSSFDDECLFDCLSEPNTCAVCGAIRQADDLDTNCDLFDDGTANGSCASASQAFVDRPANLLR